MHDITIRGAQPRDGEAIWRLVRASEALELNTCYAYVLLCDHFGGTCLVATRGDDLVGFVAAYRPPSRPDVVFVWQIGVDAAARGHGVAGRLLDTLLSRPACTGVTALEATVAPSNTASSRLFESFARRRGVDCRVTEGYPAAMFGEPAHEPEALFHIGPLNPSTSTSTTPSTEQSAQRSTHAYA